MREYKEKLKLEIKRFRDFFIFFKKIIDSFTLKFAEKSSPFFIKQDQYKNILLKNKNTYSQCYQDVLAIILLKSLNINHKKIYAEIGANHPYDDSNTFFLEKNGFGGYSFDIFKHTLWKERNNNFFENGFSDKEKNIDFFLITPPKTVYINGNPIHSSCFNSTKRSITEKYKNKIFPDSLICQKKYNLHTIDNYWDEHKLKIPDVMFIDTEGNELSILRGGNRVTKKVPIIFIENNCDLMRILLIRNFMTMNGFKLIARLGNLDDVFINKKFFKRNPIPFVKKEIENIKNL